MAEIIVQIENEVFIIVNFITLAQVFPTRISKKNIALILLLMMLAIVGIRNIPGTSVTNKAYIISGFFYLPLALYITKAPVLHKLFVFFLQFFVVFSLFQLMSMLSANLSGYFHVPEVYIRLILGLIASAAYAFFCLKYSKRMLLPILIRGRKKEWLIYTAACILAFITMFVTQYSYNDKLIHATIVIFIVIFFALMCYSIAEIQKREKAYFESKLADGVLSSGRSYYKRINKLYNEIRVLEHDYKYHLSTLNGLVKSGELSEAENYLTDLEKQFDRRVPERYSDNPVINALLISYAERFSDNGIAFEFDTSIGKYEKITEYELCIVLGNILENAFEACQKLQSDKQITLTVRNTGNHLAIAIKNSALSGKLESKKLDGGYGIMSIKAVVDKHSGVFETHYLNGEFSVYILI